LFHDDIEITWSNGFQPQGAATTHYFMIDVPDLDPIQMPDEFETANGYIFTLRGYPHAVGWPGPYVQEGSGSPSSLVVFLDAFSLRSDNPDQWYGASEFTGLSRERKLEAPEHAFGQASRHSDATTASPSNEESLAVALAADTGVFVRTFPLDSDVVYPIRMMPSGSSGDLQVRGKKSKQCESQFQDKCGSRHAVLCTLRCAVRRSPRTRTSYWPR
jgi:hypothetical protein